jgi:hypothetical protein
MLEQRSVLTGVVLAIGWLAANGWGDVEHDSALGTSSMINTWPSSNACRTARVGMGTYLHSNRSGTGGTLEVAMATVTSGRKQGHRWISCASLNCD